MRASDVQSAGRLRAEMPAIPGDGRGRRPDEFAALFPATGGALYGPATHGWRASFQRPGARTPAPGALSGGGQRASGTGSADGGALRAPGGGGDAADLDFDVPVAPGGYAWWYVDALSDDGASA